MSNDRIQYYGKNDLGTYHYLSRLCSFIDNNDLEQPIYDIDTALEWHNVLKLLNLKRLNPLIGDLVRRLH